VDDVRARGKHRPQHQGFRQLETVLTIEGEIAIDAGRIMAALERAAEYRRHLARGEEHPETLKGLIEGHLLKNEPIRLHPNGWMKIGFVLDPYVPPVPLAVWWHETTDRVRVERPESWPELPARRREPPLRRANDQDTYRLQTPIIAQPGYIYTYEGADYSPEEAMVQARKLGTIEGWTWRKA
jgi:hypothetical protein